MTITTTDVKVAQEITRQFINENPIEVSLLRRVKVQTSSGGWRLAGSAPMVPQRFRLVPGQIYADTVRTTSDGRQIHPSHTIVGMYDADVANYDLFLVGDKKYEVVWVRRKVLFQRTIGEAWEYG